jgi:ubiquinone/menaquinone biosynthesis C-methylase UbiE
MMAIEAPKVTWIGYTTLYRGGGDKLARAAHTMARELSAQGSDVVCEAVESKRDFVQAMQRIDAAGKRLDALHFIGHGGMYGPMFRTDAMPEQFSPHEWRHLTLPFAPQARAYFHTCRSARWFANFFAQTFGVDTYGNWLYTTFSRRPDRFALDARHAPADAPLYVVALPGKKSHGVPGAVRKYLGLGKVQPMLHFAPQAEKPDASYARVAELYDQAFADIGVRAPEVAWLEQHIPPATQVLLDIGTGNGALLARLSPRIRRGIGLDASPDMIACATRRHRALDNLEFATIANAAIPLPDQSVDVVTSLLSWRYLDWDPLMLEIRRVLKPGGRLLVVDMAALPLRWTELPRFAFDKLRQLRLHFRQRKFAANLKRLVDNPHWKTMLQYNPIRADHEYRWYFESRFPGRKVTLLTVGATSRVLAFDTGPLQPGWTMPQSYP